MSPAKDFDQLVSGTIDKSKSRYVLDDAQTREEFSPCTSFELSLAQYRASW
jgi:hypothetical protein